MKLFSCRTEVREIIGLRAGETSFNLTEVLIDHFTPDLQASTVRDLKKLLELEGVMDSVLAKLEDLFEAGELEKYRLEEARVEYLPPLSSPSKILALGRNYAAHAEEGGMPVPKEPIVFGKLPSSLVGHEKDIVLPYWVTSRIDHEVELAVVIGKKAKVVEENKAFDHVFGYTILNDVTARDMQNADLRQSNPWLRSKSFDTFAPLGPFIVPKTTLGDPHNLRISLEVNGEIRQDSNTSFMVFKIPAVIAFLSNHFTLLPGDIIATGTPEGIGPIREGDTVKAAIEGIGTLVNRVVREPAPE